jgi:ABC-type Fe3+ transport system permease subunit
VGLAVAGLALAAGRGGWQVEKAAKEPPAPAGAAGRCLAGAATVGLLALALAAPLAALAGQVPSPRALAGALAGAGGQAIQTLWVVLLAAPLAAAWGAVVAAQWVRRRQEGQPSAAPLVLLNLAVPASLLAFGIISLTQQGPLQGLDGTIWPIVLAQAVRFLPVAVLACYVSWRNESPLPSLAARVHGLGAWRVFLRITWPSRRPLIVLAAVLVALLSATEGEMALLLAAPGAATLAVRLSTLIHTAPDADSAALTLAILALAAPLMVVLAGLLWAQAKARGETG